MYAPSLACPDCHCVCAHACVPVKDATDSDWATATSLAAARCSECPFFVTINKDRTGGGYIVTASCLTHTCDIGMARLCKRNKAPLSKSSVIASGMATLAVKNAKSGGRLALVTSSLTASLEGTVSRNVAYGALQAAAAVVAGDPFMFG